MTKGKIIFWSAISATVLIGGYFTYKYYKKHKKQDEILCADAIGDTFVYDVATKKERYAKKKGEWMGCYLKEYESDSSFWIGKNTKGEDILIKKSDVITRKKYE